MCRLLHHFVEESAGRDAGHPAFRFEGEGIDYGTLAERSSRLAAVLAEAGVRRGDLVGVYMNKGLELPVAVYGIMKAGAAYVPIDPTAPPERVAAIVADCGLRHLVTNASRSRQAAALGRDLAGIGWVIGASGEDGEVRFVGWDEVEAVEAIAPEVTIGEDDLAYVMYTSGSTGTPKGLMHTHFSGRSYAVMSARTYGVTPGDRLGNHSPLHFDMSTFEFLTGPMCGATSVLVPEETMMFPVSLAELIERERLTIWYSVPLALVQLVTQGGIEGRDCGSLRWVLFGGEPFPPKYLRRLMELWPQARFSNSYGPAEVNQCTCFHVPGEGWPAEDPVPLGTVWEGARGVVVGNDDEPVAPGVAGELLVSAPTMMRGYWGRPDLDAKALVERSSPDGTVERYYRTGDLVREEEDGNMVFLGRKDRQVKVRGFRVELDEIEAVLTAIEGVREAAAVAIREDGEARIEAAVILDEGCGNTGEDLRSRAAGSLSPYAVPRRVAVWDRFPRTGTGKVDRPAVAARLA